MATFILNAGTANPISLVVQQAGENAPTEIGTVSSSFNGADRTSVRAVKRNFGTLSTHVDTVTKDSIINLLKNGRQLPCSGELLGDIQTQCTVRYTGARMLPGFVPVLWEVGLTANEVQPNNVLLRYAPGDTITGEAFSRSTAARYYTLAGVVTSAAINAKRDAHYLGGVRSTLLEGERTNVCIQSENFGTTWVALGTPTRVAAHSTAAGVSLDQIGDDAAGSVEGYEQIVTFAGDSAKAFSIFVRAIDSSSVSSVFRIRDNTAGVDRLFGVLSWSGGRPSLAMTAGSFLGYEALADTVYRLKFGVNTVTAANSNELGIYPATDASLTPANVGSLVCGGVQCENALFPSSYIPTTTVAVTRAADSYSLPFTTPPQEMTVYVKFVEGGTILASGARLFAIADAGGADAQFLIYNPGTAFYRAYISKSGTPSFSTLAASPGIGDAVEEVARLFGDASVDIAQSVNSATATAAAQSATQFAMPETWSGQLAWLNSVGSLNTGFTAIQALKLVAGARSLEEMRAA